MKKEKNIRKEKVGNNTYYINEEKKTIVCRSECNYGDTYENDPLVAFGIAKCSEDDTFNEEFGRNLARKKAVLELTMRINYINGRFNTTEKSINERIDGLKKELKQLTYYKQKEKTLRKEIREMKNN